MNPAPGCLTDESIALLIGDQLSTEDRSSWLRHAGQCGGCWELLVQVGLALDRSGGEATQESATPVEPDPSGGWTPPAEFDGLRLQGELGRGAMGIVYLAHDVSLDRKVAVKLIASDATGPWAHERLRNEARAMARLRHPNVVTVFRMGEVDGRPYLVSEYVAGQTLARLPKPIPWRRAITLGLGLARGLAAAHSHGLLHRDLKPSNVLVAEEGDEVKLLDFGLAAPINPNDASMGPRSKAGTPRYMAPELKRRSGVQATPRSELYSLGLVLHELCTGAHPVPGAGLAGLAAGIDPDFAALIQRCLAEDPAERYATAQSLVEALEALDGKHLPAAIPDGNPYRGLAPFEAEHRGVFFGRDDETAAVLDRLRRQSMVLVAGDSGVGKSSLCRAGVLPRVAAGALDPSRQFLTVTLFPSRRPVDALATALAPVLEESEEGLMRWIATDPVRLGQLLRNQHAGRQGLLLFIDQLEELVTLSEPTQATAFTTFLGELALPNPGVRLLLAVRGDFLGRVSALPGLGEEVERALYILRYMRAGGMRAAIVGPARSRSVVFESEELIQTLIDSAAPGVSGLPLLQFTLAQLWERRDKDQGRITRRALDELGGLAGALSRHADEILARLDEPDRRAARHVLLRLVTPDGTRVARREDELELPPGAASTALRALVGGRLLQARTAGGQASYEIAHDLLIEQWGTLRDWLREKAGQRALRQRVQAAAAEWEKRGRAREGLWEERQLEEVRALQPESLGALEQAFLAVSRAAPRRRQLRRRRLIAGASAAALALAGALLALLSSRC